MKPRKAESKKITQQRKSKGKSHFQIVKLEERIAPCHYNWKQDKVTGHNCEPR